MSSARWSEVSELFERIVALPAAERAAALDAACGGDADLLARVEAMLGADASLPPLLDASPADLADALALPGAPAAEGWHVGPYHLRRELGRGGMGVVYLAERVDLGNTVALKLIHRGSALPDHTERFQREQAVHAQLEHPHIARLLDAGVADDGTPWMAMEYVEGTSIDAHCDDRQLSVAERLALFEQVAEAVAYAHRNLVVHRDLKPSNILVTAAGAPKLVDFGIAKLLSAESGADGRRSSSAGWALTLDFASPEQLRAGAITTATDVYQLGLLLHQLLTGLPASDPQGRPLDPAARLAEREPASPSSLTEIEVPPEGELARPLSPGARAALRRTTPDRLRRALAGDLDTIIRKAIRPDPADRYASAQQLAEDVRRHREGLPVLARPGSPAYRFGKLVRRNRVASALTAALILLIAGAALTLGIQAGRVTRERDRADQFSYLLEGLIYGADPLGTGDTLSARTVLDRTARQARASLATEPEVWGRMLVVVGRTYENMGHLREAIAAQQDALRALGHRQGGRSPLIPDALRSMGGALVKSGDLAAGIPLLEEGVQLARERGVPGRAQLGALLGELAEARFQADELDSAATLFRAALEVLATLPDSGAGEFDRLRVGLGNLLLQGTHLEEAQELLSGAVDRLTAREGAESGATLHARTELSDILLKRGRLSEAERMAAEVLEVRRRLNRGPHEQLANALLQHGRSLAERGQTEAAARSMREATAMWEELHGPVSLSVAYAQVQVADALKRGGRLVEARALEENSLAQYLRLSGPGSVGAVHTALRLAQTEFLMGKLDSSERRFREAMASLDTSSAGRGRTLRPLTDFGELLVARGACPEAMPQLERALAIAEEVWGPAHPRALRPRLLLGTCLTRERRFEAAEAMLLPGYRQAQAAGEYAPQFTGELGAALVRLYEGWGRREEVARYRR